MLPFLHKHSISGVHSVHLMPTATCALPIISCRPLPNLLQCLPVWHCHCCCSGHVLLLHFWNLDAFPLRHHQMLLLTQGSLPPSLCQRPGLRCWLHFLSNPSQVSMPTNQPDNAVLLGQFVVRLYEISSSGLLICVLESS